eukprot:12400241-Karenia_brevis.AAC.1
MELPDPLPTPMVEVVTSSPGSTQPNKYAKGANGSHRGHGAIAQESRSIARPRAEAPSTPRKMHSRTRRAAASSSPQPSPYR